jgi:hypothetical protein
LAIFGRFLEGPGAEDGLGSLAAQAPSARRGYSGGLPRQAIEPSVRIPQLKYKPASTCKKLPAGVGMAHAESYDYSKTHVTTAFLYSNNYMSNICAHGSTGSPRTQIFDFYNRSR